MRQSRKTIQKLCFTAALLWLSACTPIIESRGAFVDPEKLSQIQVGTSTATDVQTLLGTPSASANFGDLTWYYIGQEMESLAFYRPEVQKQEVVIIRFNKDATVSKVEKKKLDDGKEVNPVKQQTETADRDMTIFQQLLGNVGRFSGKEGQRTGK